MDYNFDDRPDDILWTEKFAYRLRELYNGECDIHSLLDFGYELYPTRGKEDPVQVADQIFAGKD